MSPNASSGTEDPRSRRDFQLGMKDLFVIVTVFSIFFGAPLLMGSIVGVDSSQAMSTLLFRRGFQMPILFVWVVGGILIFRRWNRDRSVSRFALIAVGGLLAIWLARTLVDVWALGTFLRTGSSEPVVFIYAREIVPQFLMAICWALLIAAVLGLGNRRSEKLPSLTKDDKNSQKYSPFGIVSIIVCTLLGAGSGFCLQVISEQLINSPSKSTFYVIGGCFFGLMVGVAMDFIVARSR